MSRWEMTGGWLSHDLQRSPRPSEVQNRVNTKLNMYVLVRFVEYDMFCLYRILFVETLHKKSRFRLRMSGGGPEQAEGDTDRSDMRRRTMESRDSKHWMNKHMVLSHLCFMGIRVWTCKPMYFISLPQTVPAWTDSSQRKIKGYQVRSFTVCEC